MPVAINQKLVKFFEVLSYGLILANIVAVPLFIDSRLNNFYIIPKQYVFIGLILAGLFFFAAKVVITKKLIYRRSYLDLPLLIFLITILFSSLFSSNIFGSFLGRNDVFLFNFVFLLFCVLFYFFIINFVNTPERWRRIVDLLIGTGSLCSALFILKTVFNLNLPYFGYVWNVVDGLNSAFGLWMIIIFALSAGLLMKKNIGVGRALFYFFAMIVCFVPLVVMGFKFLWWIVLAGLILLLLLGASFIYEARIGWLSVLFAVLALTCVFIIFGSPKSLQSILPAEVSLDIKPSWTITKNAVFSGAKSFLIGSGPGTFAYNFSKFRTQDFNYDAVAWSLRFSQPFNTFFALLSEVGVLGFLGFVFILLFVLGHVLSTWFKARGGGQGISLSLNLSKTNIRIDIFLAVITWLLLWFGMGFGFFSISLWVMWWLMLGLIIAGLDILGHQLIKSASYTLEDTPQYNLAFSFSIIVVMAVVILVSVLGARFYLADLAYAESLKSLRENNVSETESNLKKAVGLRDSYDLYHGFFVTL